MYEIRKISEDIYQLHCSYSHEQSVEGTLIALIVYATYKLGFDIDEIELALLDLIGEKDRAFFYGSKRYSHSVTSYKKQRKAG